MRGTHETTIDGKRFVLTQLGAADGRKAWLRLVKLLGPGTSALLRGTGEAPGAILTAVLSEVIGAVDEETFEYFVALFARHTEVDGARLDIVINKDESPLTGDFKLLLQWLLESLRFNFSSFLADLGAIARRASPAGSP